MKVFQCAYCDQLIYFENSRCGNCGHQLGFHPEKMQHQTLIPADEGWYLIHNDTSGIRYRYCANHAYDVCNWLTVHNEFCVACAVNRMIPDLTLPQYLDRWRVLETAKHRLVYALLRMRLPFESKLVDAAHGLSFDFKADLNSQEKVLTGHARGIITINIAEADDIERELMRRSMDELYRTVLGHFRHEIGHYYWDRLVAPDAVALGEFRNLFGNEQDDYAQALNHYYTNGPQPDWQLQHITAYASSHPWESWAETWAHYMHILDTLETAYAFGLSVHPYIARNSDSISTDINVDPYTIISFNEVYSLWVPLTIALNSLNRSMGLKDLYPFVVSPALLPRFEFIHRLCRQFQ